MKRLFTALVLVIGLAGCAGTNPVKPALESRRPELVAYALEGSYTIVQGKALEFASDPQTPAAAVQVIKTVDAKANPILDASKPLALEAKKLREDVATCSGDPVCATKEDRLASLLKQLDGMIDEVAPLINSLLDALAGGVAP